MPIETKIFNDINKTKFCQMAVLFLFYLKKSFMGVIVLYFLGEDGKMVLTPKISNLFALKNLFSNLFLKTYLIICKPLQCQKSVKILEMCVLDQFQTLQ